MYRNCIADLQLSVDDIDEDYIKQSKAILISGTALAESPSREAALKAVMLAKKNDTKIIFDIDYREYNWKSEDEISIYYSMVAREADIIMGSREEFDLTEKLIQPGRTDEETAAAWHAYNAKIVVIKHGMKGLQHTRLMDRTSQSNHSQSMQEKDSVEEMVMDQPSYMESTRDGKLLTA